MTNPGKTFIKFLLSKKFLLLFGVASILTYGLVSMGDMRWGSFRLENDEYITVQGVSKNATSNNIATFSANVTANDADRNIALDQVKVSSEQIVSKVLEFGISKDDIKTNNVNLYQQQEPYIDDSGVQKTRPGNWVATMGLEIKLRQVERANDLTTLLATYITSDLWGPNYSVDDSGSNEAKLIEEAINDAYTKAVTISKASGRTLGPVLRVVEGYNAGNMMMFDRAMSGGGGGFMPGTTEVSKTVTVTYSLR